MTYLAIDSPYRDAGVDWRAPLWPCHRSQARMTAPSYAAGMDQTPLIEDSRGVDLSQIRRQLRMTVPERVRSMVEAANTLLAIRERAQAALRRAR